MAPRKGRSPVATAVTQQSLEQATAALAQLPERPKTNYSLREAITQLQGTINTALERGYSHQEVAEMLGEQGIRISPASLKSYLAAVNRDVATAPKKQRAPRKAKADKAVPQAVEAAPQSVADTVAPPAPEPVVAESVPESEPAPKKTRGPRKASKASVASSKEKKSSTASTGSRRGRRKAVAAS